MSDTSDTTRDALPPERKPASVHLNQGSMALPWRFGPYVVQGKLGRGGMGAVLRVKHEQLGAEYALKVLPDAVLNAEQLLRFQREIQTLTALSGHPNIVAVHACGVEAGRPWYVMDRVEGVTLADLLEAGPLPIPSALKLGIHMSRALAAAHGLGMIHRDVKPQNILIVGDLATPEGRAVLLDFGLATLPGGTLTKTGEILGTPAFLAPEQAMSERGRMGPATDVFGLGAVLYVALTGERPYTMNTTSAVGALAAILHEKLKPPRVLRAEIPEALERVLVRCLEKEPARRYKDAADLGADLEALSRDEKPKGAAPPRRSPVALAALVGLGVAALAGIGAAAWLAARPSPPPPPTPTTPAPPPTPSPPPGPLVAPRSPIERARADLDAALRAHDEKRLDAANKALLEVGATWTVAEALLATSEIGRFHPAPLVELALRERLPDDPDEREALKGLVDAAFSATTGEHLDADDARARILQAALEAGIEVADLDDVLEPRRGALALQASESTPTPRLLDVALRIEFASLSMRARDSRDSPFKRADAFKLTTGTPPDLDLAVDVNAHLEEKDLDLVRRARLLARDNFVDESKALLDKVYARAGTMDPRFDRARLELMAAEHPKLALADLADADGKDSPGIRFITAAAHGNLARRGGPDAAEHEKAAVEIYRALIAGAKDQADGVDGNVLTYAYSSLVKLELALGRRERARAWFARARFKLRPGGAAIEDLAKILFTPPPPR